MTARKSQVKATRLFLAAHTPLRHPQPRGLRRDVALGPQRGHMGGSDATQSWPELCRPADFCQTQKGDDRLLESRSGESARLHSTEGETEARDAMNHSVQNVGEAGGGERRKRREERKREGREGPES